MAPQSTREPELHTADQSAADVRRLVEQVTTDARKVIEQVTADARKTIEQGAADARKVREMTEELLANIERMAADRESRGHSATSYSRTGRSVYSSARSDGDYEDVAETVLNDMLALTISDARLWFRLQRIPWVYLDLLDHSIRRSAEVQRRIYFETLKDAVKIVKDIMEERTTPLPAQHTVKSGDTLSGIANRYYGDASEPYWRKIYDANKEVIGGDPHQIRPGDRHLIKTGETLTIPA
jgi:nucleoid-associated protein YgaU